MMLDHLMLTFAPARAIAFIAGALALGPPFRKSANRIWDTDKSSSLTGNCWVGNIIDRPKLGGNRIHVEKGLCWCI